MLSFALSFTHSFVLSYSHMFTLLWGFFTLFYAFSYFLILSLFCVFFVLSIFCAISLLYWAFFRSFTTFTLLLSFFHTFLSFFLLHFLSLFLKYFLWLFVLSFIGSLSVLLFSFIICLFSLSHHSPSILFTWVQFYLSLLFALRRLSLIGFVFSGLLLAMTSRHTSFIIHTRAHTERPSHSLRGHKGVRRVAHYLSLSGPRWRPCRSPDTERGMRTGKRG